MSPKHLWSGDWRQESEAEARERRERPRPEPRTDESPTTVAAPRDTGGRGTGRGWLAAGAATGALVIAGGAFALGGLVHGGGGTKTASGGASAGATIPAVSSATAVAPRHGQTRAGTIYAQASPAVVSIRNTEGSGTGFLVDRNGTIVTNDHVVGTDRTVQIRFGTDGRVLQGTVKGTDPSVDLAVVHIDPAAAPASAKPLQFADSDQVQVGDTAIAIGNPFGLDRTATEGIVSSLGRSIRSPNGFQIDGVIQTDAAINPGNSGGPLLDDAGHVIGINSQIAAAGGGGNVGIGFAVPSNTVRAAVPALERGQVPRHAWLGVNTNVVVVSGSQTPGGPAIGTQITGVSPGGPAQRAGLRPGDIITKLDGQDITDPTKISTIINAKQIGDRIAVTVRRNGHEETHTATLQQRPRTP